MSHLPFAAANAERTRHHVLTASADPDTAATYLADFEHQHPEIAARLQASSPGLQALVAVFANSRFLSEAVLRHPEWAEEVFTSPSLHRVLSSEDMRAALESAAPDGHLLRAETLAQFRRRQLLRIVVRDVLGLATLSEVTEEISNVADAILDVACRSIRADLTKRFGEPVVELPDGTRRPCGFSVIALGKLGGRELNYSSDIDLMFIYEANGQTEGQTPISNKEFFKKVANTCTDLLSTYTSEGMCYRVDLRLRPDGTLGEVCISLEGAQSYYSSRARDWELQMLIKARVAAGEANPGRQMLDSAEARIYSSTLDFSAVEAVSATRERIHEKLAGKRARGQSGIDIKLTRGGIRDIEFLVQCLQRLHGGREPWVRHGGTLPALARLYDKKLISDAEHSRLASAYEFLRHLEHRLQILDDRQTHAMPPPGAELEGVARRMPRNELGRTPSAAKLLHQLNLHLEEVQETYERVIHAQQPLYYSTAPGQVRDVEAAGREADEEAHSAVSSNAVRFLDQCAPGLKAALAQTPPRRSAKRFEVFIERVLQSPEILTTLDTDSHLAADVIEIFEHSPWFAEELIRRPAHIEQVADTQVSAGSLMQAAGGLHNASELRRWFQREMLRIQAESICRSAPVFDTLGRTSDLADAVISCAYRLACDQIQAAHAPASDTYEPGDQMMVIALGRLGMREFDLGSDADLNFVLPDEDASESQFWTRVAERTVDIITAYTGEGNIFAVDTRLRPNGREGTLVQTVSAYKEYLSHRAEAWEGITYMKSRAVVGNTHISTHFLHELQETDWRRYGQSGRSRTDLRNMRTRLEREQGSVNPLKAGSGGFYDVDFALMYLRLRSAGIFYTVLNTPERIDIIEKMGHLDREDAAALLDAATLYRAIDHGLRLYFGHAEGRLPQAPAQLETIAALVRRWTPGPLHDEPLPEELSKIQTTTRAYFRRLFG